jgi:hypothetical protein
MNFTSISTMDGMEGKLIILKIQTEWKILTILQTTTAKAKC